MKPLGLKIFQLLLAVTIMGSALAPSCSASASCDMPCCRQEVPRPADHHSPTTGADCCGKTAPASPAKAFFCSYGQRDMQINSGAFIEPVHLTAPSTEAPPAAPKMLSGIPSDARGPIPVKTPVYLASCSFLI